MRLDSGYDQTRARVEMVPLIDCMFLLLVFFMYAMVTMSVHRGIRVSLPGGTGQREQTAPVMITVDAGNRLRIGDRVVTAGIDGVFPPGLPVGAVAGVEGGTEVFQTLRVAAAVDFRRPVDEEGVLDTFAQR